jgi:glycerol-3-phosphate dehydrogenase
MQYDLVVIGAGIQGAGVAQAAAAAGHSVLVLEQTAIAAGTSSKSSKLIHGGLRYLESAQFGLVRESLQERALLLKLAPDLVKLKPLHIPVYHHSRRSPMTIRLGLSLYAALGGFGESNRFANLPRSQWHQLDGLQTQGLRAVFRYAEAQTDDAALTAAVLRSAQSLGAELLMPARFEGAELEPEGWRLVYEQGGRTRELSCRVLVNAAGPWATRVNQDIRPAQTLPAVELIQGSHLLLPPLLQHHFYLESPGDGRAVFLLPWRGQLLVGTTETPHSGAPEEARCLDTEKKYLLACLRHYFPHLPIEEDQVASFAGLRVLPKSPESAFSRSREVLLAVDNQTHPRLLTLMGGKLTTYRATAEKVLARLRASLPARERRARTSELPLV